MVKNFWTLLAARVMLNTVYMYINIIFNYVLHEATYVYHRLMYIFFLENNYASKCACSFALEDGGIRKFFV